MSRVVVEDRYVPNDAGWRESFFTIGNGYLMTRGSFEESRQGEIRATFVNGAFVAPPGELPLLGAVPDWTGFEFTVDGERFDLDARRPAGYHRELDLADGVITRSVLWRGAETGTVRVDFRRVLPLDRPHLAAMEVTIEALTDDVEISFSTGIAVDIPSPTFPVWNPLAMAIDATGGRASYRSVDDVHTLEVRWRIDCTPPLRPIDETRHPRHLASVTIPVGSRLVVTKHVTYQMDRDPGPAPELPAPGTPFVDLANGSARAWARRWKTSKVTVEGDPQAELAFDYAAFQLIGAAPPGDRGAGIGARIGGFGYRHHVFWDTDIFVAPYFALTQPDLARTHLGYRYDGLPGARKKAARYGRRGAFYAWEAAGDGDEVTPDWSSPKYGEPVRIWTGEIEEHITADVAWCADHYWRWTGDDRFMETEGAEMIIDGATYWMSRVESEGDGLHLRDVIGPDEYHIHVDDNFYTNLFAAWQLRRAGRVESWLRSFSPERADALLSRLGVTPADLDAYAAAADRVVLHRRDDGVWEQHQGFFDLEEIDLTRFEPRVHSVYDLLGEQRMQRTAVIKQPDVLMAMTLLPEEADRAGSAEANWSYYEPKADHGSSLSLSFHALLAARMKEPQLGYELFRRAVAIDFEDSMGNGSDGIHTACQGGLLLTGLFGFAGLGLEDGRPVTHPSLPDHWRSMSFTILHRGRPYEMEVVR